LVIVDNLSAAMRGMQENTADARQPLDMLTRISRRTGAVFLVLHHTTKPGQNAAKGRAAIRGSSALFDAAAGAFILEFDEVGKCLHVKCEKARGGFNVRIPPPFCLKIQQPRNDAFQIVATTDETSTSFVSSDQRECERILTALQGISGQAKSKEELRALTKMGTTGLNRALSLLTHSGRVQYEGRKIVLIPQGNASERIRLAKTGGLRVPAKAVK
jgi:hypothetical protein